MKVLSKIPQATDAALSFSFIKLTPSHLQLLSMYINQERATTFTHTLILGGEALLETHLAFWRRCAPLTRVINEYGPTETTVGCSIYEVSQESVALQSIPIGRPIANMQLYVLDAHLEPLPIGAIGELYIGGIGIAREYWRQPDLTAERFLPNPFSDEPGTRLYRTGDRVRYLPNGNLEFLGRTDQQVKLRGFRIDLGEIESLLLEHENIQEAAVLLREDTRGIRHLVAYIVPRDQASFVENSIQAFLREKLPDYMVPTAFLALKAFPLNSNGKVERQAFPVPGTLHTLDKPSTFPTKALEKKLSDIWKEILCLDQIGIYDNFFDIGGNSLLAVQMITKTEQAGIHVTLKQFFLAQTIAELTKQIEKSL